MNNILSVFSNIKIHLMAYRKTSTVDSTHTTRTGTHRFDASPYSRHAIAAHENTGYYKAPRGTWGDAREGAWGGGRAPRGAREGRDAPRGARGGGRAPHGAREGRDAPGLKVWVAVRTRRDSGVLERALVSRARTGGLRDTGGIYATILNQESIRQALASPQDIHVEAIHRTGEMRIRPSQQVRLSTALGPFHDRVCSEIGEDEMLIGPAYPVGGYPDVDGISDTQVCVSGGVKRYETDDLTKAAIREVQEELGFEARVEASGYEPQFWRGKMHHLFWAYVG